MHQQTVITSITPDDLKAMIREGVAEAVAALKPQEDTTRQPTNLVSRKDAANLLGVSLVTLSNWDKNGTLKAARIGRRVLYDLNTITDLIEKQVR